jgi:hypothetical protein
MTYIRTVFWAGLCLVIASCAKPADGPGFQPAASAAGKGIIYVYALSYPYGKAKIDVDGKPAAIMEHRGHVAIPVTAGKHTVRARKGCIPLCALYDPGRSRTVNVPSGGSVYLRIGVVYEGMPGTIPLYSERFEQMPEETALMEIRQTRKSSPGL